MSLPWRNSTALGIAGLAGFGGGFLDLAAISIANPARATYLPALGVAELRAQREAWHSFVVAASAL